MTDQQDTPPADLQPPADLGDNAHQVVTALLGHQEDLMQELRSIYDRLEQVRTVEYRQLHQRVEAAESTVTHYTDQSEALSSLRPQVDSLVENAAGFHERLHGVEQQLAELAGDQRRTETGLRETIDAQQTQIQELTSALKDLQESQTETQRAVELVAEETGTRLIDRVSERVGPAAHQARQRVGQLARRLKR